MGFSSSAEPLVYEAAHLYDIAFSYRDYEAERRAITSWFRHASKRLAPRSVLEIAAGPGDHAITFAKQGARAVALDLSRAMCRRAEAKAKDAGVPLRSACCNMIDFELEETFDLALLMINSVAHIYTLDDLTTHLRAVARHLNPGGVYVLEMMHPRDFVGRGTRPTGVGKPWVQKKDDLEVEVTWGSPNDPYDPIRQVFEANVTLIAREGGKEQRLTEKVLMRDWSRTELEAAVKISGVFELAALHGDFDADADFDAESWRMIAVLRQLRS